MTAEVHKLGEVLRSAREAKGVDLARVERDTKIRARYLSALESGGYRDLPGAVYTKGFLRNYGLYLGLDPEYLVDLYRLESAAAGAERRRVAPSPRPIAARRSRAFVLTPGAIVAAVLTIAVAAFVYYLGRELITFARTPDLRITEPAGDVAAYHDLEYTLRGVAPPNSRITVDGLTENPTAMADEAGNFSVTVRLLPGSNVIGLTASDPVTKRDSETEHRTIQVISDQPSAAPGGQLALTSPRPNASASGPVTVAGTAPAGSKVTIAARLTDAGNPGFSVMDGQNRQIRLPKPRAPDPITAKAGVDGAFESPLALAPGRWEISVTPASGEPITRRVEITAPKGLRASLRIVAESYLEVTQDGMPKSGVSGRIAEPKDRINARANDEVRLRAGNAAAVEVTVNGIRIGRMGAPGAVVEWVIRRAG